MTAARGVGTGVRCAGQGAGARALMRPKADDDVGSASGGQAAQTLGWRGRAPPVIRRWRSGLCSTASWARPSQRRRPVRAA
jgi:hypothetical protein